MQTRDAFDERVLQSGKRAREGVVKVITGRGGRARYEARLETKRHRVTSRRRAKQDLLEEAGSVLHEYIEEEGQLGVGPGTTGRP
jgi:hypothetical protein